MRLREYMRNILILAIVGTLVSAQQVSSESVFSVKAAEPLEKHTVQPLVLAEPSFPVAGIGHANFSAFPMDTIETFEVEVEEEKGPGIVRQLIVFGIITAIVGYAVIELMASDDEPPKTEPKGKEPPVSSAGAQISIPLIRSR